MAETYGSYTIDVLINEGSDPLPPKEIGFTLHDSIYTPFPDAELLFQDLTGTALEFGTFMQGVPARFVFGLEGDLLDVTFRSICRDSIKAAQNSADLSGVVKAQFVHDLFFSNRKSLDLAFHKKKASDAVKELFPDEEGFDVEDTVGNINSFAQNDPYVVAKEILLPQATNGIVRPYVFYRDLENKLHFCSTKKLETDATVASFKLKATEGDLEKVDELLTGFLPFNENLRGLFPQIHANGKSLKKDLSFTEEDRSIATDATELVPLIGDTRAFSDVYFGRQFNPAVDYGDLESAFFSDALHKTFFLDKALCFVPFSFKCVAGKSIELAISMRDTEGNEVLSEYYSGKWLIEQSWHAWSGSEMRPYTKLLICRSSLKGRKDSILADQSFRD